MNSRVPTIKIVRRRKEHVAPSTSSSSLPYVREFPLHVPSLKRENISRTARKFSHRWRIISVPSGKVLHVVRIIFQSGKVSSFSRNITYISRKASCWPRKVSCLSRRGFRLSWNVTRLAGIYSCWSRVISF
jgi:hypothetical protein